MLTHILYSVILFIKLCVATILLQFDISSINFTALWKVRLNKIQLHCIASSKILNNCVVYYKCQPMNLYLVSSPQACNNNPNQNTPGVKKLQPRPKKRPCWKRCKIKMGSQDLLLLMELKFLIIMNRPQNITVAC